MKQSQKNYLLQRLHGVYTAKKNAVLGTPQPKLSATDIRALIKASGLKLVTHQELVNYVVQNQGTLPYYTTRSRGSSETFGLIENAQEFSDLLRAHHQVANATVKSKLDKLDAVFVSAKDKVMLGDDAEGALAILKELQSFEV